MTKRSLLSLRNSCLPLLIACAGAVITLQFVPVLEAFQIPRHTSSKTRTTSSSTTTTTTTTIGFAPLVSVEKKKIGTRLFDKQQQQQQDDDDHRQNSNTQQAAKDEEQVEVGTKEYYSGFLSSPIQDESAATAEV